MAIRTHVAKPQDNVLDADGFFTSSSLSKSDNTVARPEFRCELSKNLLSNILNIKSKQIGKFEAKKLSQLLSEVDKFKCTIIAKRERIKSGLLRTSYYCKK